MQRATFLVRHVPSPRHVSRTLTRTPFSPVVRNLATNSSYGATMAPTAPIESQTLVQDGQEYAEIQEGRGRILVPFAKAESSEKTAENIQEQQQVFYNPIQQFNRDLTVLAIKAYGKSFQTKHQKSHNTKAVAKRKREKLDDEGRDPKKQESTDEHPRGKENDSAMDVDSKKADPVREEEAEKPTETAQLPLAGEEDSKPAAPAASNTHPGPKFTILDALSATGLRALRYAQELSFVTSVTANDLTPSAVEAIRRNAEHNGIQDKINATQGDARAHMYSLLAEEVTRDHGRDKFGKKNKNRPRGARYNVIDLDPYGTAAPFLDAAVNAVRDDGGLLCVTCTDSGVWASNGYPEKAFSLYGGIPIKGFFSHEVGLRLILQTIASSAARYGLAIEPLLSLSIDYYVRVFVKITKSPAQVKFLAGKTMMVYNCDQGCGAWETQLLARNKKVVNKSGKGSYYKHGFAQGPSCEPNCKHCGAKMHLAGPMYAGPLHSPTFIREILADLPDAPSEVYGTKPRIEGMLQTALEETIELQKDDEVDPQQKSREDDFAAVEPYPFYFHLSGLAGALHCICPDEDSFRGALRHLGYRVTRSHCKAGSMKTNAPWSVVWHVMREWGRQKHPIHTAKITESSPTYKLLRLGDYADTMRDDEVDKLEVVFDQELGHDNGKPGLIRYQTNPTENWGPQTRAKGH
ncbi:N2,N2-dimethylguanosine tRNA methyltransferase [Xylariaceae sp. FL1272]|nr:N2,N2-dimethylguanosine tRNA methyltransferase [Xylariaceae sp. FL1272]